MLGHMLPREFHAAIGVVLGSGLGHGLAVYPALAEMPYAGVEGIPAPTVPGHGGKFIATEINGHRVLVASGRVHLYEGHDARAVGSIIRVMASAGVRTILLTNAAGGLHHDWQPGTFMRITDHLNLTGTSPLEGSARFLDMSAAYDPGLGKAMESAAIEAGLVLKSGVYAGLRGPQYETPAEVRMVRTLGADAVGMSTVLECLQARALGLRVAGLSLITNPAAGLGAAALDHLEVMAEGRAAAADFAGMFARWLPLVGGQAG